MYFIVDLITLFSLEWHARWIVCNQDRELKVHFGDWETASDPAEMNGSSLVVKQMYGNLAAVSGAAFGRDGVMLRFEFSFWAWGDRDRRCSSAWSFICFLLAPPFVRLWFVLMLFCLCDVIVEKRQSSILLVYQALAFTQWHNCYSSLIPVLLRSCRALREKTEENCP